jgi:hypothetical protein
MFRAVGALRPTKGRQRSEARPRERIKTAIRATRATRHSILGQTPPRLDAAETSTRGDGVAYATTTRQPLPCPPTKSICNDFADTPGSASSSAVLAAAATARRSPFRMYGVPCDGVCIGTIVDVAGSQATGDHKRAWSGDTRQSNATRRARLEKRVEIDFYRRILDTVRNVNARIGAGRAGSCKDWPRSVDWGVRPGELALLYGHGGLLVPRAGGLGGQPVKL